MREILFRGKQINGGAWAEGCLLQFTLNGETWRLIFGDAFERPGLGVTAMHHAAVVPNTVGQYTGLTDKNGKRIFEGDIIKTHYINTKKSDFVEQVVFHNAKFCSMFKLSDNARMWANLPDGVSHLPQDKTPYMDWCEIIGNIHDNPELLEDKGR